MEGAFRPGHFNGVAQIVSKLFDIVNPDRAYFGDKDFQQLAVIRQMSRQLNMDIEIIGCPIVREEDGLALSSRNALLTQKEKKIASNLSRTLFKSRIFAVENSLETIRRYVLNSIESVDGLRIEYFEIVDGNTLQPVQDWKDSNFVVGCLAAYCGKIRLIDNIKYKE
jgi:pantoate--beta-alanine ligase